MANKGILMLLALVLGVLILNSVSAYDYYRTSDRWEFNEDIKGAERGFTLVHNFDVPRNTCGYWDWSYKPKFCGSIYVPDERVSERIALEAFRTFGRDSQTQFRIDELKERKSSYGYGSYGGYRYPRYYYRF